MFKQFFDDKTYEKIAESVQAIKYRLAHPTSQFGASLPKGIPILARCFNRNEAVAIEAQLTPEERKLTTFSWLVFASSGEGSTNES